MAKSSSKRGVGRPPVEIPLDERVMVRLNADTKAALEEYTRINGQDAPATAARMILIEKLRKDGLLK